MLLGFDTSRSHQKRNFWLFLGTRYCHDEINQRRLLNVLGASPRRVMVGGGGGLIRIQHLDGRKSESTVALQKL
jgi:hypothetical protein